MKKFNKDRSLKRIRLNKNKSTYIKRLSITLSCLILLCVIILFAFAKFESGSEEYTLINGKLKYGSCDYELGHEWTFSYTGNEQDFEIPCNGDYKIELWGAQGGTAVGNYSSTTLTARGGYGSYTEGVITLKSERDLYIYVGGAGSASTKGVVSEVSGGYNGGGSTIGQECCPAGGRSFGSGGGATDVRLSGGSWDNFNSLKSRIMVAAGGGGGYAGPHDVQATNLGGNAGGLTGYDGTQSGTSIDNYYCFGKGGTQTEGGRITSNCRSASSSIHNLLTGYFGQGGQNKNAASAGGGGYYGGSRSNHIASAGGGSSFISGHNGCNAITQASVSDNIVHTNQANHYSNYVFTSTKMIDGSGYAWTNAKGSLVQMPKPSGGNYSSGAGHTGNGYAKITLISTTDSFSQLACASMINSKWDFSYSGNAQTFDVPCDGNYKIELWGAEGGSAATTSTGSTTYAGGKGAYTKGNISLEKRTRLIVQVGGKGTNSVYNSDLGLIAGGYNGGGPSLGQYTTNNRSWGTGGGATDIRLEPGAVNSFDSLKSRIMVAAGGGGGFAQSSGDKGGDAGGLNGYNGSSSGYPSGTNYGTSYGGKQNEPAYLTGYVGGSGNLDGTIKYYSKFGYSTVPIGNNSAGGGGGYYAGINSGHVNSASGGSSFISGYSGCNAITELSTDDNIEHTNQANHYSGKVFTSGVMIDGKGCNWSSGSAASCGSNQPQPTGSNTAGHSGNGYARITLLSI